MAWCLSLWHTQKKKGKGKLHGKLNAEAILTIKHVSLIFYTDFLFSYSMIFISNFTYTHMYKIIFDNNL